MKHRFLSSMECEAKEAQLVDMGEDREPMTIATLTRWALLLEAFNLICEAEEEQNREIDFSIFSKRVKPIKAMVRYINERYHAALRDIIIENNF